MNHKELDEKLVEKIILNSLGTLNKNEEQEFKSMEKSQEDKEIFSEFNNLVSQFSKLINISQKKAVPFDKIKEKIFEKIEAKNTTDSNIKLNDFDFIYADSNDWIQLSIEGIKFRELAVNKEKGYVMLLMNVAAGAQYPSHHHKGAEECYVIEGDLHAEGKILGPGDFHHAESGSDHAPLYSKNGCTAILIVDPEDYM